MYLPVVQFLIVLLLVRKFKTGFAYFLFATISLLIAWLISIISILYQIKHNL